MLHGPLTYILELKKQSSQHTRDCQKIFRENEAVEITLQFHKSWLTAVATSHMNDEKGSSPFLRHFLSKSSFVQILESHTYESKRIKLLKNSMKFSNSKDHFFFKFHAFFFFWSNATEVLVKDFINTFE